MNFRKLWDILFENSSKRILFIPDIDKWEKWDTDINTLIQSVDPSIAGWILFILALSFPNREMSEIPHPFVIESMDLFSTLAQEEKKENYVHPLQSFQPSNF